MDTGCTMCTLRKTCEGTHIALFAENPLLQDRLRDVLSACGLQTEKHEGLFVFPSDVDGARISEVLKEQLSGPEQEDIRIGTFSLGGLIGAVRFREFGPKVATEWFEKALRNDSFQFHFQPIVDLERGEIHAHECLVRLFADRAYNGGEIISAAFARGRIHVFDAYCRQKAIRDSAIHLSHNAKLFVNFLPSSIYDPEYCLRSTLAAVQGTHWTPQDIVFEVVESEQIQSIPHLNTIRDFYKSRGFGFALDDVGSGSNSLQMMSDFRPDYIKLDKSLTSGLDNRMRLVSIQKLIELAHEFGIRVIAEGVETADDVARLREVGVKLMQGWYFGKPSANGASAESLDKLASILNSHHVSVPLTT